MNGFGLHVIPMVGLILLSWLGLRSLGMERGAPPAAPGWPSGCTFPEVELPGGQSSQARANQVKEETEEVEDDKYVPPDGQGCFSFRQSLLLRAKDTYAARSIGNKYEIISRWLLTGLAVVLSRPNWLLLAKQDGAHEPECKHVRKATYVQMTLL